MVLKASGTESAAFCATLRLQSLEFRFRAVVNESHHLGDGAMPGLFGDETMHLLPNNPIRRMTLGRRPELDEMHRFARVHVHREPDAVRKSHRI
jgi:hypothetical protein